MDTIDDLWDLVAILLRVAELSDSPDFVQELPLCLSLLQFIDLALAYLTPNLDRDLSLCLSPLHIIDRALAHLISSLEVLIDFDLLLSSHNVAQARDLLSGTRCIRRSVLATRNRVIALLNNGP